MQAIDNYIDKVRHLPPVPRIVPQLMKLLQEADVESSKVVQLISLDPALTASVLRICNTAYFAAGTATSDLQEAITRLGFQQVYQLVAVTSGAKVLSKSQKGYGLEAGELWKHSVASAVAAQLMARKLGDNENLVFTCTLLHDLGKVVLSESLEAAYGKVIRETEMSQQSLVETEKKLLGVNHAEVGGQLLKRWKFPPNMVAAVWFHHTPQAATPHQRLASYIYLGNMVAHFMGHGFGHQTFALRGREEALTILGLTPDAIPQFMMETFEQLHLIEALLGASPASK